MTSAAATRTGLLAILLWSTLALLTAATGQVPPFLLTALTFAIGGAVGVAAALAGPGLGVLVQRPLAYLHGVGGLFGYHFLYFAALKWAPPAEAGLINYLWPLLIVLLSALLPGGGLRRTHVLGALLGFAGTVVLLVGKGGFSGIEPRFAPGYLAAFACAFIWSAYSVASRFFAAVPTHAVAGFCLVTAALAGLCHLAWEPALWPASAGEWAAVVALGVGPVGIAFYAWDIGMKKGDVRLLGVASYAAPVLSTLLLVAAGYAAPSWSLALACLAIVGGAFVATRRGTPSAGKELPTMPHPALSPDAVAVITGGASGIGLAAASRLAAHGLKVVIADLPGEKLDAAAAHLATLAKGGAADILAVATDVSRPEQLEWLEAQVAARFGGTDLLMNNAGVQLGSALFGPLGEWEQVMGVNLWGVIHGSRVFAPKMLARGKPALIVNTGSKQGITTPPGDPAYNLSKAGVKVFTEALQHELRNTPGARLSAHLFIPGFVFTPLTAGNRTGKPAGAWTAGETVDFMFERLAAGDFYILCPDNDVPRALDEKRIAWAAGDIIHNRPPLSRWHKDYANAFAAFIKGK